MNFKNNKFFFYKNMLALRILLSLIFSISIFTKLYSYSEVVSFISYIFDTRESTSLLIINALTALEFYIAINLIINFSKLSFMITLFTLLLYSLLSAYLIIQNNISNCYCFGNFLELSPLNTLIKNVFLFGILFFLKKTVTFTSTKTLFDFLLIIVTIFTVHFLIPFPEDLFSEVSIKPIQISKLKRNSNSYFLIDSRPKIQYEYKHINGAINLHYSQRRDYTFYQKLDTIISKIPENKIIVTYCDSKICFLSSALAKIIKKKYPYKTVMYLEEGIEKW